jgi:hypothetical protein
MSESDNSDSYAPKAGRDTPQAQSSTLGGLALGDQRLSTSVMSAANEGSQGKRRPWAWALGFIGVFVIVIAGLVLILR